MKQFKKLAAPLLAAALLMGTAACGGGGATSSAGTSSPDSSSPSADAVTFTVTADVTGDRAPYVERFAQLVEEKTEGRYTASIIAAGSLGTGSDMAQMLQMGTLDVLMSDDMTMDGVLDGALGFAWLPGLVADYEEADAYYNNGWIADKVAEIMAENGLIRISSFCGALPVMISGSEVLNALQTGTVDGLDNAVFNYTNQGITDVITHITELNYCYSGGCFIAGSPFWDKLSDEDKAIFAECAQLASDEFTTFFREKTESMTQEGLESGQWTVDQPSDDMKAAMQEISEEIWEESREKYGDEIMDVIISGEYRTLSES